MDRRTVRSGLVVGLLFGYGLGGASGYPNNSTQIGNQAYYSSSDLLAGSGSALFIGGALADYLNFGFWFGGGTFQSHDWTLKEGAFGVRAEVFPLYSFAPVLKGLGAFAQFGFGTTTLDVKNPPQGVTYPEAKGTQSFIGVGALWEFTIFHLFGGHAVIGPTLEYDAYYSSPMSAGSGLLGGRFAFYGGM
jgi:hypothetical protein